MPQGLKAEHLDATEALAQHRTLFCSGIRGQLLGGLYRSEPFSDLLFELDQLLLQVGTQTQVSVSRLERPYSEGPVRSHTLTTDILGVTATEIPGKEMVGGDTGGADLIEERDFLAHCVPRSAIPSVPFKIRSSGSSKVNASRKSSGLPTLMVMRTGFKVDVFQISTG